MSLLFEILLTGFGQWTCNANDHDKLNKFSWNTLKLLSFEQRLIDTIPYTV